LTKFKNIEVLLKNYPQISRDNQAICGWKILIKLDKLFYQKLSNILAKNYQHGQLKFPNILAKKPNNYQLNLPNILIENYHYDRLTWDMFLPKTFNLAKMNLSNILTDNFKFG